MVKIKIPNLKAHNLIFIYIVIFVVYGFIDEIFITKNISIRSAEKTLSMAILYTGVGFLIKHNVKLASILFIFQIIGQTLIYTSNLNDALIMSQTDKIGGIVNYIASIIIVFYVFYEKKNS
jgi:hypothetical protein